jgi:hypothetical protein
MDPGSSNELLLKIFPTPLQLYTAAGSHSTAENSNTYLSCASAHISINQKTYIFLLLFTAYVN